MTETRKQIKELKAQLPHVKEKLSVVLLMLVLSLVMVGVASYAWITLSRSPELGGVNTTIAANGNLEVALSDFDGLAPAKSGVDSFSAENQTVHSANTSWGNLVNLSTGYGMEGLVLRPAKLKLDADAKIHGVHYGADGRVEGSATDFGFTTWHQVDALTNTWKFVSPDSYPTVYEDGKAFGVRAISSVTFQGDEDVNQVKINTAAELQGEARDNYVRLTTDPDNIEVIRALVQTYLDENIDAAVDHELSGNDGAFVLPDFELDGKTYIPGLTNMLSFFYDSVILKAGDALVYMANLQKNADVPSYTLETLLASSGQQLLNSGVKLSALGYNEKKNNYSGTNVYTPLHNRVKSDKETMLTFWEANGQPMATINWSQLEPIVNNLIDIGTLTVEGKTVTQIGNMGLGAQDFVNSMPKRAKVVVSKGSLFDFETISAEFMSMSIKVVVKRSYFGVVELNYDGYGVMTTKVSRTKDSLFITDLKTTEVALNVTDNRTKVAQDTYGMMLDLWVRTNAANAMLTLNGTPKLREFETHLKIPVTGENDNRPVYIYHRYTGKLVELPVVGLTPETEDIEVYQGSDGLFYNRNSYALMKYAELIGPESDGSYRVEYNENLTLDHKDKNGNPVLEPKMTPDFEVIGYESANRIWKEDDTENNPPMLAEGEISSTQGSGSCYIFYSDSPEAYERAKELLGNLRLVFLNAEGKELARAFLDVEHTYPQSGKYTVPISISSSECSVTDEDGNLIRGICDLKKNEATQISVLVYLDGEQLENDMVLSSEAITGSLNLQFDSTEELRSVGDSELSMDIISLDAEIDTDNFTYGGESVTSNLTATIKGLVPTKVEAIFMRQINSAQGSRMAPVELKDPDGDNTWSAEIPFAAPGTYVLNSLWLDGVEYPLPQTVTVTVEGFKISSVTFNEATVMTANRRVTREVVVSLAADQEAQPQTMEARFMTESGHSVSVNMKQNGDTWSGSANFSSSGTYTLQYLVMDDEYYELNDGLDDNGAPDGSTRLQRSFTAFLGLTTEVVLERYITDANGNQVIGPLEYFYDGPENIQVTALIFDDAGNVMRALDNVVLWYKSATSVNLENGFKSELEWNGSAYKGQFNANKAGSFVFAHMNVGGETIGSAASAMKLRIIPKDPPEFIKSASEETIVASGTAYYQAKIAEASAAKIWAVFNDGKTDYEVEMSPSGTSDTYQAAFPDLDNTAVINSNGKWTVKELRFTDVYANGKFYNAGDAEKYKIPVNEEFLVVNHLQISAAPILLGATKAESGTITRTAAFMTAHSLKDNGLAVEIWAPGTDASRTVDVNVLMPLLKSASLVLKHGGNTNAYGSYTMPSGAVVEDIEVLLDGVSISGDKVRMVVSSQDKQVRFAGSYSFTASVTANNGQRFTGINGTKLIEVYSKTPEVIISSIYQTTAHSYDAANSGVKDTYKNGSGWTYAFATYTTSGNHKVNGVTPSKPDNYNATVYTKCTHTNDATYSGLRGGLSMKDHDYDQPTVTMKLTGIGQATNAELVFNQQTVRVFDTEYAAEENSTTYTWTSDTTCMRYIGYVQQNDGASDAKKPAGTLTANTIKLTYDGKVYTLTLDRMITINNPA